MKKTSILFALLCVGFTQADHCYNLRQKTITNLQKLAAFMGGSSIVWQQYQYETLYPVNVFCAAEELLNSSEEEKKIMKKDFGAKSSYKDFIMIWRNLYKANWKVAKSSSVDDAIPGVVSCRINEKISDLIGHKKTKQIPLSYVYLPEDVCNKYSSPLRKRR